MSGPRSDQLVLMTTFVLTIFIDLTVAVQIGMVLAAFLFMRQMAQLSEVRQLTHEKRGEDQPRGVSFPSDIELFSVTGALFFCAVHKLLEVDRVLAKKPRALLLDLTDVIHLDASGLHMLRQIRQSCSFRNIRFGLIGLRSQPVAVLEKSGLIQSIGTESLFPTLQSAASSLGAK